eukprot:c10380_g1_i1.p1 GENE.c10380_g1_i1~~c10380_g1_i1.p1  ORF type:complete len:232 (+),score=82.55 c10380_g1_i1:24-719(+)
MRCCVFCSSSPETSEQYLEMSREVARLLTEGGHVCVNGGGKRGCMGALNAECVRLGGKVVGCIHETWVIDGAEYSGIELKLASGPNLHQRKELLLKESDCFIVLPGGLGTWDELWEVVSEKQLGIRNSPVCIINVGGFYDGFIAQMERTYQDKLLYYPPSKVVHVVNTAQEAIDYCLKELKNPVQLEVPLCPPTQEKLNILKTSFVQTFGIIAIGFVLGSLFRKTQTRFPI